MHIFNEWIYKKQFQNRAMIVLVYNIYEMNRPSPDDMNDIIMAEQRAKIKELEKENKELKEKLALTKNDRDEWQFKAKDLFNKREMTWKDEFLDKLRELLQD